MKTENISAKKDWRIGITWDVLIIAFYVLLSLFEILSSPSSFNVVNGLLIFGLAYFVYSTYKIQRNQVKGIEVKKNMVIGFALFTIFILFSLTNLFLMASGQLNLDSSYLNIMLIIALGKTCLNMKKLRGQQ